MPTIVIKPDADEDFYVGWSTNTESPHWWGTRAEATVCLTEDATGHPLNDPATRLRRADANGTSAAGGSAFLGQWSDEGLVYEQRGFLPRRHLIAACEALSRDDEPAVWDLLEPLADDVPVLRG